MPTLRTCYLEADFLVRDAGIAAHVGSRYARTYNYDLLRPSRVHLLTASTVQ